MMVRQKWNSTPKKFILLVKIRLHSRIEDKFLTDHLLIYIEKEISKNFTIEMIMD
jgi:hypothetical protein